MRTKETPSPEKILWGPRVVVVLTGVIHNNHVIGVYYMLQRFRAPVYMCRVYGAEVVCRDNTLHSTQI